MRGAAVGVEEVLAFGALLVAVLPGLDMLLRGRPIPRLRDVEAGPDGPRLSVVVAVRNEESTVGAGIRSLLRQEYADLEVIVVNDRSTDATGAVLASLASQHAERLNVIDVAQLPSGWLGKPHALWIGAQRATGEWLLFTDADVVFDTSCLRRAVLYAERCGLDHLTVGPEIKTGSFWLGAFVAFFTYLLMISLQLYRVNDPTSNVGVGLGAFNLMRKSAYQHIGGYAAVARRPDDDIRLGQKIRQLGLRQQLLDGTGLLHVEWYPSLPAAILGLEKNFFAGYDYNVGAALASNVVLWLAYVWPWLGVWRARARSRTLILGAIGAELVTFLQSRQAPRVLDVGYALAMPISAMLVSYASMRSVVLALRRGGIRWRDTFYSLSELRG